jgi:hypothetical protein
MSLSAFFYLVSVVGAYQLGAYTASHPGAVNLWCREMYSWINRQCHSERWNKRGS